MNRLNYCMVLFGIMGMVLLTQSCGTDEEPLLIQFRLDNGETPIEIYNSNNTLLDSLYGKTYQGGLITYLNTATGTGLIAVHEDQSSVSWGCQHHVIMGTNNGIGDGQANTTLIVNGCEESEIAAKFCDDLTSGGYDDWFLPSIDELNKLYLNLHQNDLSDFHGSHYWSSTQHSTAHLAGAHALYLNFGNGAYDYTLKLSRKNVRAVRAF